MEFDYLLKQSNLPKKLQKPVILYPDECDVDKFTLLNDLKQDIVECVEEGFNLYIYSNNCGNGKTSWSIKMLLKYFDSIWNGNGFVTRGIFIHVPTFLYESKNFITGKDSGNFSDLKYLSQIVDLVVWDDIAATRLTDFEQNLLISIIDHRQNNQMANIFTSNMLIPQLEANVGKRLASRLLSGIQVQLNGQDMRKGNAYGNATDFK